MDRILRISRDGTLTCLYTEDIDLHAFGAVSIARASNVEYDNARGGWTVQVRSDSGFLTDVEQLDICKQHARLFSTRQAALDAEIDYLQRHI